MSYDLLNMLALVTVVGAVTITYSVRLALRGRVQFERVNRQGGSVLLGKGLMEMAYWSLQPLARILVLLRVTPNQISWASLVLGGIAGSFLAYGKFGTAALVASASAFMDSLDGMVARMTGHASEAGEVLDATIDRYVEFFFLAGLVIFYRDVPLLQILSLFALMGSFMVSYSTAKAEAMHMEPPPGIMRRPERAFYLILGAALSPLPLPYVEVSGVQTVLPMATAIVFTAVLSNISAIERLYTVAHAIRLREEEEARAAAEEEEAVQASLSSLGSAHPSATSESGLLPESPCAVSHSEV